MKILLVRPARIKQAITLGEFMYSEPIGLEIVYAMLEDKHQLEILDLMSESIGIEEKLREYKPQVVGLTSLCIDVYSVRDLAKRVKNYDPTIITVVGGTQAYLNSQSFFIPDIDHVLQYTTTENINLLFDYLEKGDQPPVIDGICSQENGFQTSNKCGVNEYICPNRKSTAKYRSQYSYFGYKPCAIMATAQGCSKTCSFCLRWRIEGLREKYFDMEEVIREILSIEEDNIMIFDNDFLHNPQRIEELCNFLERANIEKNFICYGSVDSILRNQESIRRFATLGLRAVLVGYESFKEKELLSYKKKSTLEDNLKASKILKELGIDAWASFIIHPDWDREDFQAFRKYLKKLAPEIASFSPLTPFPNLPMYKEYQKRLLYKVEDYEAWSFGQVVIAPSQMSLQRYYYEILKTNLYINLFSNNVVYLIKKFGPLTVFRLSKGSIKLMKRYLQLMFEGKRNKTTKLLRK